MSITARPFNYPYDGNLDPAVTALLVIDLQIDFLSEDGYFARKGYDPAPLRAIIPNVNALIAAARGAGCAIVHTRQGYRADRADMTPYEVWRRKRAGIDDTQVLLRSSPGYEIVPEIDVKPEDIIVDKTANGAFTYTDLEHVLRAAGSHISCSPVARRMSACTPPCARRRTAISRTCLSRMPAPAAMPMRMRPRFIW
jgi:isochorismate hydrolase